MSVHKALLANKTSKSESRVLAENKWDKINARLERMSSETPGTLHSFKMISTNATHFLKLKPFQTTVVQCDPTNTVKFVIGFSSQFMRMKQILTRFTFKSWLGLT
jgi:hypothetical protein